MSDSSGQMGNDPSRIHKTDPVVSVGTQLRDARERQGFHIADMASLLKVSQARIKALEEGHFEQLPDMVFARALAYSMCRVLKMDATAILSHLPQQETQHINIDPVQLNTPFRYDSPTLLRHLKVYLMQPLGVGVLLLMLGIAVVLWIPTPPRIVSTKAMEYGTAKQVGDADADADAPSVPLADSTVLTTPSKTSEDLAQPSSTSVVAPDEVGSALSDAATSVLLLEATDDSWVSVTDATGHSLLRRMLHAGETIPVSGVLPLSVVLGKADVVVVTVRGKRLDVLAYANRQVARFEVD
jgi:cytoskeleton protein RodZ